MLIFAEEENQRTRRKTLGAGTKTNNELNPRVTLGPGIKPGPQWWEASAVTTAPLCSQYCSRFIPSSAIIASPLWDVTKTHAKWKWGTAEENAFQAVKRQQTQAPVMAFFKQGAETCVITETSRNRTETARWPVQTCTLCEP